ncbi:hypothetical protein MTO96_017844 [Rhipicephalus appendiculatus]
MSNLKHLRPGDFYNRAIVADTDATQHEDLILSVLQEDTSQELVMTTSRRVPEVVSDRCVVLAGPVAPV